MHDLERELRRQITGEVRFDAGSRAAWSTDASNYRHVPVGVVLPRTVEDVVRTVGLCRKHGVPVTSRGGGTSLAGQACNVAVIIDSSKYFNRITTLNPRQRIATVEPGCVLDDLRRAAAPHGLTFGPDPATHNRNTLGGMIGNNSCGVHSVMSQFYGPGPLTAHQVIDLDILTYDGQRFTVGPTSDDEYATIVASGGRRAEIYQALRLLRDQYADRIRERFVDIPRRVSGFNLEALLPEHGFNVAHALVGTEGTCVVILGATLHLIPARPKRTLVVLGYTDAYVAADHVPEILAYKPVGLEGMDDLMIELMKRRDMHPEQLALLPEGRGWLLVEFGDDSKAAATAEARAFVDGISSAPDAPHVALFDDDGEARKLWEVREAALGVAANPPGMKPTHEGWEDAAVAPENLGRYLREFRDLLAEFDYHTVLYGHFGQGCVHCRIDFDLTTADGVAKWMRFLDRAADLVVRHGGSISGEHGDGQARGIFLTKMYGAELVRAFEEFKAAWDPDNRMNPGRVVHPRRPDQDLRVGPGYAPLPVVTHFAFGDDNGSFAHAAERCVGVGACRRNDGAGTMCPSYAATREEHDSTRGRARLLFEMLQGDVLTDGWKSEPVREALDLCLACKGCKRECPVSVDMATYKAEFLAHHYEGRVRPRSAYTMGLIHQWARLAAPVAPLVNIVTQTPPFSALLKALGGIALERRIPRLASPTFRSWFRRRKPATSGKRRVILWPDTFSNHFRTAPAIAAVEVLEDAGFEVTIPRRPLCCGRPLYDWGMLDRAKGLWRRTIDTLRDEIRAGTPIVGLEPSCVAAFRDELPGLLPHDDDAQRLSSQTVMLSEFLAGADYRPNPLRRQALVHGHCHHKAVMTMKAEESVMRSLGLEYQLLDSGCCGMAGSFGFEAEKYAVSIAIGEQRLLPAVRAVDRDTLIVANGFSCHEQIAQQTGRVSLHLAEVLQLALHQGT
ncbi:MAG TPA: FAD-binding and (Fe-S)-binding domain-containing protein [Gemmatimonadales bacterium]|jgi:FAD/FMN-containing dehydrogenase/Fe-S oxidoreductase